MEPAGQSDPLNDDSGGRSGTTDSFYKKHQTKLIVGGVSLVALIALITGLCVHFLAPKAYSGDVQKTIEQCSEVPNADSKQIDHSLWDDIVRVNVKPDQIKDGVQFSSFNYQNLANNRANLDTYVNEILAKTTVDGMSCDAVKAFYINAYNALTVKVMLDEGIPASIKDIYPLNPYYVFQGRIVGVVMGEEVTLDNIEHDILRAAFPDPRIHAAVVCASLSCPDLRNSAFTGELLEQQLTNQSIAWMENPTKGAKYENGKLTVSKIFMWYKDDFQPDPQAFVHQYMPDPKIPLNPAPPLIADSYFDYDWKRNEI